MSSSASSPTTSGTLTALGANWPLSASASCTSTLPRILQTSRYGMSSSASSPTTSGTLTALGANCPLRARATCSATCVPARSCASLVEAPRCGVLTTWSYLKRMSSVVGSLGYTSTAAAATLPLSMARARASSSTMPPRATLMTRTPSFILAKALSSTKPSVSAFLGRCTVMKSASR